MPSLPRLQRKQIALAPYLQIGHNDAQRAARLQHPRALPQKGRNSLSVNMLKQVEVVDHVKAAFIEGYAMAQVPRDYVRFNFENCENDWER